MEHSRLLKFLVPTRPEIVTMDETPSFKVQYEYQNPNNVESEVPGSQSIREVAEKSPDESTDGAEIQNGGYTITRTSITEHSEIEEGTKVTKITMTLSRNPTDENTEENAEVVTQKTQNEEAKPKTKIPKLKFRQAAERVRRERRLTRATTDNETHIPVPKTSNSKLSRISKIPPPTSKPLVIKRESKEMEDIKPDDEFDKIYEEVVEKTQTEIEIEHPEIIENKFEEIIHDYDENKIQPINVEKVRQSRIPFLRRRTSEHAEPKSEKVVLSEKTKTRSLPRLKEIAMRVKEDDESLSQMKFSRTLSTESTTSSRTKTTSESRIPKHPPDSKISKLITTERTTNVKEPKSKVAEASTESTTVHKNIHGASQSDASVDIGKKPEPIKMEIQTEDIMKHSVRIGYVSFESEITENSSESYEQKTGIDQVIENVNDITSNDNVNVTSKVNNNNVSETKNNLQSQEVKSPTIERSMTITRVVSSSNDTEGVKGQDSPTSPTGVKENLTRITTERRYKDDKNSPTIERSTIVSRSISSSSDVKVQEVEEFKSKATEKGNIVEKITTERIDLKDKSPTIERSMNITRTTSSNNERVQEPDNAKLSTKETDTAVQRVSAARKFIGTQNKSHSIERSENLTHVTTSNDTTVQKIEHSKSLSEEKETSGNKDTARQTIMNAISKQIIEKREVSIEEPSAADKDENIEYHKVEKATKVEEITTVNDKVGKLIHRIDSNEVSIDTSKKELNDLPKKKSILSKIAMFERQGVEDRMPPKKPANFAKLVIKHPPPKTVHLHTPKIVEEVLKSQGNSPLTAQIHTDGSQQVVSFDYKLNTEVKQENGQTKEIINEITTLTTNSNVDPAKTDEVATFDYKIKADEYNQIVELTKVKADVLTEEIKENVAEVATLDYKLLEAEVNNTIIPNKKDEGTSEENSVPVTNDNVEDKSAVAEPVATLDFQFKGVKKLASAYEQKVDMSKETSSFTETDIKTSNFIIPESVATFDYKVNVQVDDREDSNFNNIETTQQSSPKGNISSEDIAVPGPTPIMTMDYKINVNRNEDGFRQEEPAEDTPTYVRNSKVVIPDTPDLPTTFEYTFKDVKKLATEYEQRAKISKNLDVYSRVETLSPVQLFSESLPPNETSNTVIVDAPVILVSPKIGFKGEVNLNKHVDESEIAITRVKESAVQHTAERTEFKKQISKEYKQHTIENKNLKTQINNPSATTPESSSTIHELAAKFNDATNYDIKVAETRNNIAYVTQTSTKLSESTINNLLPVEVNVEPKEAIIESSISTETQTKITENITDRPVKSKGYVIKHEGDLAYAQIQDDSPDNTENNDRAPELPKTPPPKLVSNVTTKKFKSIEEKKKYYADVDINAVLKGKVSRMISRMTSLEQQAADKKLINVKEMPRKMSVLEKVAMYEKKLSADQSGHSYIGRNRMESPKVEAHVMTEEEYQERIMELKSARLTHGMLENMPHIILKNGVEMPVLALGTATLDPRLISHIIGAAIDLGYRAIDTAYIYGNEKEIGEAIRAKIADGTVQREELFIISKLWSTFHRTDLVEKACRSSLETMGLDYFDLYLIHNPMSFKEGGDPIPKIATVIQYSQFDYLDAWFGMEQVMKKGLVRSIGVSNFNSAQLQRILDKAKIKPTVNQVECHPYLSQQKLEAFCEDRGVKLSCFGVLGSKGTPSAYKSPLPPVIDDPLVQVMASGLNISPAQLLIRYQLDCGRSAVVKSSSAKHLWDNLQAVTLNLTSGQVDALHALNRNKRIFTFKGMGDTHKNYPFKTAF